MIDFSAELHEYRTALHGAGLARHADALVAAAQPSVRLVADLSVDVTVPGVSRLGGLPDVPARFVWPTKNNAPLSFIGQVNLRSVTFYGTEGQLPMDGLLSFFYDAVSQSAWGFDPADRGAWAVLHSWSLEEVAPRGFPLALPAEGRFPDIGLTPCSELTVAPWESSLVEPCA